MKRDALIRELRKAARQSGVRFEVVPGRGKGSHYRVVFGGKWTTVQAGDLTPMHVARIKKQLGIE